MVDAAPELDGFVPYRLSIASNAVSDVIADAYKALFDLSVPEWRLIAVVAEHGKVTQLEIGTATRMDKVSVSRAAIALVGRGLFARGANPVDGRSHLLWLTAAGTTLYRQIVPKALALERQMLAHFTVEEVEQLMDMLRRFERAATEIHHAHPAG